MLDQEQDLTFFSFGQIQVLPDDIRMSVPLGVT